jgi:GDPmannose 4,6-dehydratase
VKKALITGISGQDGSYLAELLLSKGYEVHGIVRRVAFEDPQHRMWRLKHILKDIKLHNASVDSYQSLSKIIRDVKPSECYHLAAQSYVSYALDEEFSTLESNIKGAHYVLAALKEFAPECHLYFAASSEMFGNTAEAPQTEMTRFHPRSAYGISKIAGFELTRNYREQYNLHASSGILFNHESPRRGFEFVTRKITSHAARIKLGLAKELHLGNLEAKRDWGHAKDYVRAMWLMTQQQTPSDYVIASGEPHSVREFAQKAFEHLGLNYKDYIVTDERLLRPAEKNILTGNPAKAMAALKWKREHNFDDLVKEMVEEDLKLAKENN